MNIITGPGEIGMELVTHPDVAKVAFTGSTAVGKMIARAVAGTGKKVTLELGGKAANIVFDDAPLDQAIEGIINGIYFNQGEVCCAGLAPLRAGVGLRAAHRQAQGAALGTLRVGDPLDKNTDVGAINSAGQLAKVQELVESGIAEGAEIFQPACELPTRGFFFRPTLFTGVSQSHRIAQEEIFGPVLSVLTFRTPGGGDREGQQHALRAVGRRVDREGQPHLQDGRRHARRRGLGQHLQPIRPDQPVRRLQGVRATGARAASTASAPTSTCPTERPMIEPGREISLDGVADRLVDPWKPVDLAAVNETSVRLVRLEGDFPWHHHTGGRALPVLARRLPHRDDRPRLDSACCGRALRRAARAPSIDRWPTSGRRTRCSSSAARRSSTAKRAAPDGHATNDDARQAVDTAAGDQRRGDRAIGVRKTYKLYIGGAFPSTESGAPTRSSTRGARCSPTPAAGRARTSARPCERPARRSPAGAPRPRTTASQILYRIAELLEGRRDQFVAEVMAAEGVSRRACQRASSMRRSTAGSGTPAGPTSIRS